DKSFNADFKTDLDKTLPKVSVIPQEIGRVLLNLINNAFYTISKRSKEGIEGLPAEASNFAKASLDKSAKAGYVPMVMVKTKKNDKIIEITVQDNGNGIPKDAIDKIFQPFFTTKPTGQGTGLGLSLAYDIITKGHDGHLEVETEEGMGTRFIVRLPST
ncbi:MAG: histidine kinase, partial [Cyclobacteriaceae bacterium]|nr:histidine kinase [Cyclobacteriaceae bacterium]